MQLDGILLNETQLDASLSRCVAEQRRSDFAMLLAMLSHDALDFAEFHLPKSAAIQPESNEARLRASLGAGPVQPLAPENFEITIGQDNAAKLMSQGMAEIRLAQCLNPEPLAIRDDKKHIPLQVIDNCELAVRRRHLNKEMTLGEMQMDAAAFYDQLTDPQLQAPLYLATA